MVVATSICSILFALASARILRRLSPAAFVPVAFAVCAVLFVLEWLLEPRAPKLIARLVYLQVSGIGPALGSGFWLIASERFDPHTARQQFGRLAGLVASMPSWIALIIEQNELDLNPPAGGGQYQQPSTHELVDTLDENVVKARESLLKTNDDYLLTTNWQLLVGGKVVGDWPRHIVLRDTLNHLAHHRGQLTVYLRLNDQTVPAIYGPSADDQHFA